jgi:hypothetical protein
LICTLKLIAALYGTFLAMHLKNMLKAITRFFLLLLMLVFALVSYYYVFPLTNTDHRFINADNENEKVSLKGYRALR